MPVSKLTAGATSELLELGLYRTRQGLEDIALTTSNATAQLAAVEAAPERARPIVLIRPLSRSSDNASRSQGPDARPHAREPKPPKTRAHASTRSARIIVQNGAHERVSPPVRSVTARLEAPFDPCGQTPRSRHRTKARARASARVRRLMSS